MWSWALATTPGACLGGAAAESKMIGLVGRVGGGRAELQSSQEACSAGLAHDWGVC